MTDWFFLLFSLLLIDNMIVEPFSTNFFQPSLIPRTTTDCDASDDLKELLPNLPSATCHSHLDTNFTFSLTSVSILSQPLLPPPVIVSCW